MVLITHLVFIFVPFASAMTTSSLRSSSCKIAKRKFSATFYQFVLPDKLDFRLKCQSQSLENLPSPSFKTNAVINKIFARKTTIF